MSKQSLTQFTINAEPIVNAVTEKITPALTQIVNEAFQHGIGNFLSHIGNYTTVNQPSPRYKGRGKFPPPPGANKTATASSGDSQRNYGTRGSYPQFDGTDKTKKQQNKGKAFSEEVSPAERVVRQQKRDCFVFSEMGLPDGTEIVFGKDSSIKAIVGRTRNVYYEGEWYSLHGLTKILAKSSKYTKHLKKPITNAKRFWYYKGTSLYTLWKNTYVGSLPYGRKENFTWEMLGIPLGATLRYVRYPTLEVTTANIRQILHRGKIHYLRNSGILFPVNTRRKSDAVMMPRLWMYNGKTLQEIRDEREREQKRK